MRLRIFSAGYCTGPGKVADKSLPWKAIEFPAPFALIEHPTKGPVMFDTGYHTRFYEHTKYLPESLMAKATPCFVDSSESAASTLEREHIAASQVKHLVLSHLHADHVAGVRDFDHATIYCHGAGWRFVNASNRFARVRKGYLTELLPNDFPARTTFIERFDIPISQLLDIHSLDVDLWAMDLFDDGLLYLVSLPGHAAGHIGLLCRLVERWVFLLADACWLLANLESGHEPHSLASFIYDDASEFNATLKALASLKNDPGIELDLIPSHCKKTIAAKIKLGWMQ